MALIFSVASVQLLAGALLRRCCHVDRGDMLLDAFCNPPDFHCPPGYQCVPGGGNPYSGVASADNIGSAFILTVCADPICMWRP